MGRPKGFDRTELLEKAGEVFWSKGFADTSITDLEKATGVAKSGIYSEFKDKSELYVSCLKFYVDKVSPADVLNRPPLGWQNIVTHFNQMQECAMSKGCFMGNSVRETAIIPDEANEVVSIYFANLKSGLEKNLVAAGFAHNAKVVTEMIFSFALGTSLEQNISTPEKMKAKITEFLEVMRKLGSN